MLVRAGDLPAAARARRPGEPVPVALTFDDDLPSHREHAAPVLARHGAPATAFLCDADGPFWWQLLQRAVDDRAVAAAGLPPVPADALAAALDRRPGALARVARTIEGLAPAERDAVAERLRAAVADPPAVSRRPMPRRLPPPVGRSASTPAATTSSPGSARTPCAPRSTARSGRAPLAYPHGKAASREAAAARAAGTRPPTPVRPSR